MRKAGYGVMVLALATMLASCTGAPDWVKHGATPDETSSAYADCRANTQRDIQTDVNIDTDIAASMQRNWQHSQSTDTHLAADASLNNDRTRGLLKACMETKGYAPTSSGPTVSPGWWPFPDM
ncbi:MAG: hypothetical protein ACREFD_13565 [Stellaceae bacterium]